MKIKYEVPRWSVSGSQTTGVMYDRTQHIRAIRLHARIFSFKPGEWVVQLWRRYEPVEYIGTYETKEQARFEAERILIDRQIELFPKPSE